MNLDSSSCGVSHQQKIDFSLHLPGNSCVGKKPTNTCFWGGGNLNQNLDSHYWWNCIEYLEDCLWLEVWFWGYHCCYQNFTNMSWKKSSKGVKKRKKPKMIVEMLAFGWLFCWAPWLQLRHSWCFSTTASSQRTFSVFSTSSFDSSTSSGSASSTCSLLQCLLLHVLGVFPGWKKHKPKRMTFFVEILGRNWKILSPEHVFSGSRLWKKFNLLKYSYCNISICGHLSKCLKTKWSSEVS